MLHIRTSRVLLWTLTLLLTTLACNTATSLVQPDAPASPSTSTQAMQQAACPAVLSSILSTATNTQIYKMPEEESRLVVYPVQGNALGQAYYETVSTDLLDEQANVIAQQSVWSYFAAIIPQEKRQFISQFSIVTDGEYNLMAAVAQTASDPTRWALEVDIADSTDYENLTFTLIHEFGHLLTLNADQVSPSLPVFNNPRDPAIHSHEASMCPNYFTGEGCSQSGSYINAFYQRFWMDKYEEWNAVDSIHDDLLYYERLNKFYEKYQDQFVTDYAATNPGEDIAESWTYFILSSKPQGSTIAEQKVLFFYEYAELVELRQQILHNLCNAYPE